MSIVEQTNDKLSLHLKVTIPSNEIDDEVDKEIAKIAKTVKMDGFRIGKVPKHILQKKYADSFRSDVTRTRISEKINDIIKERKLRTAMDPQIDDLKAVKGEDVEFILKLDLLPEFELPEFSKISIDKPVLKLDDKDIDKEIEKLAEAVKSYDKETKGKAKKGDQLTIDATGFSEGEEFAGGKLTEHKLVLGSGVFIPGFEDQLIGAKAGDDVVVKVTFPENYQAKNLAGKAAEFKVKVLAVHTPRTHEIDDEFAKKFNCENLKQLKEQVAESIKAAYSERIHTYMKMKLFDQLEDTLHFDIPQSMLDRELSILKKQTENMGEDNEIAEKSDKEKEAYYKKLATRRVRLGLMLAEYVQKGSLAINEEDIKQAIIEQTRNFPGQEQQVVKFYLNNKEALESLKGPILEEKAVRNIFAKEVIIADKQYTKDKLDKLLDKESL